jgi:dTDP-4-amino-4,6-dideoxygalactose transaminase
MLGFNYRMDELRAAIGLVQLNRLKDWNNIRERLSLHYRKLIAELCSSVLVPFTDSWHSAHHLMPVVLPAAISRQAVIDRLRRVGIQTTIHYPPVHRLAFYRDRYPNCQLPLTEAFSRRELTLPLHPQMTPDTVELVVRSLAGALSAEVTAEAIA